jgi:hypothetical protein
VNAKWQELGPRFFGSGFAILDASHRAERTFFWNIHILRAPKRLTVETTASLREMSTPMSALGHKRTFRRVEPMSVLPPKADIAERDRHVRFVPKADAACSSIVIPRAFGVRTFRS